MNTTPTTKVRFSFAPSPKTPKVSDIVKNKINKNIIQFMPINNKEIKAEDGISDNLLKEIFEIWWLSLKEIWSWDYNCVMKHVWFNKQVVDMWTWFAIVSESYIKKRGAIQWIHITQQWAVIWTNQKHWKLYFIWPMKDEFWKTVWASYSREDMYVALWELLKNTKIASWQK